MAAISQQPFFLGLVQTLPKVLPINSLVFVGLLAGARNFLQLQKTLGAQGLRVISLFILLLLFPSLKSICGRYISLLAECPADRPFTLYCVKVLGLYPFPSD